MENFSPVSGFIGGALIGSAALLFALFNGRIAGVSGILGGTFGAAVEDRGWRLAFVIGLVVGPFLVGVVSGAMPAVDLQVSLLVLIPAGVLVGVGTRLGNGCTSGHGICGIARGSQRSVAATAAFFAVAALTVFVLRHVVGG